MVPPVLTSVNLPAIRLAATNVENSYQRGDVNGLSTSLTSLRDLITPLPDSQNLADQLTRLASPSRSAIDRRDLDRALVQVRTAADGWEQEQKARALATPPLPPPGGSGLHGTATQRHIIQPPAGPAYTPRVDQAYIAQRACTHFRSGDTRRGIFRFDTGMGKSLTAAWIVKSLREKIPDIFRDALVVVGCHQAEPARDLASQIKAVLPNDQVAFLEGGLTDKALKGVSIVTGTYQQLAQETSVGLLKAWADKRRILFVLDEADMVVWKGHKLDENDEPDATGWHPSWFRPLIEFGLFNNSGHYQARSPHYMLGMSATLDRPDGIVLSEVWGPGNVFYHTPMAEGVRKGLLVAVVGKVLEMDIPPDADPALFRDFTSVDRNGRVVVDQDKVANAAGSDYAVKTAVRAVLDHLVMETGVGTSRGKSVRTAIGYAADQAALIKHMRWQQELFGLVETVFNVTNGFNNARTISADAVQRNLGGKNKLKAFGEKLRKFLYYSEWAVIEPLWKRALASLEGDKLDSVRGLFEQLYGLLNVEARKIRGRRLVAAAVWQDMERDDQGHSIPRDEDRSRHTTQWAYPNKRWPNRFGDRDQTMWAVKDGEIDMVWSIGMLDRGFNAPMASLIIDNSPTTSRRMVVQRAGRIMRPPDGRNPTDHSKKPEALYVTLTPNLMAHRLDLSRQDLARLFGMEVNPDTRFVKISAQQPPVPVPIIDTVQLELANEETVHVIRVGANTAKAVGDFLKRKYGRDFDPEVAALDAGIPADALVHALTAVKFPKESHLKKWMKAWGAAPEETTALMSTYHSDLADMRTVYGGAWKIVAKQ